MAVRAPRDLVASKAAKHRTANRASGTVCYCTTKNATGNAANDRAAQVIMSAAAIGIGRDGGTESNNRYGCRGKDVLEHAQSPFGSSGEASEGEMLDLGKRSGTRGTTFQKQAK
jgi:hypothetical protein